MLTETTVILTRKKGESILADGPCLFTIKEISGNRVKVACTADESVRFVRTELFDRDTELTEEP